MPLITPIIVQLQYKKIITAIMSILRGVLGSGTIPGTVARSGKIDTAAFV